MTAVPPVGGPRAEPFGRAGRPSALSSGIRATSAPGSPSRARARSTMDTLSARMLGTITSSSIGSHGRYQRVGLLGRIVGPHEHASDLGLHVAGCSSVHVDDRKCVAGGSVKLTPAVGDDDVVPIGRRRDPPGADLGRDPENLCGAVPSPDAADVDHGNVVGATVRREQILPSVARARPRARPFGSGKHPQLGSGDSTAHVPGWSVGWDVGHRVIRTVRIREIPGAARRWHEGSPSADRRT